MSESFKNVHLNENSFFNAYILTEIILKKIQKQNLKTFFIWHISVTNVNKRSLLFQLRRFTNKYLAHLKPNYCYNLNIDCVDDSDDDTITINPKL